MENQVLSIDQMKHLQELGLDTSKASMYWFDIGEESIPTFTLYDILEELPYIIEDYFLFIQKDRYTFTGKDCYRIYYGKVWKDRRLKDIRRDSLLDATYEMLCWCIENGYIKTK